MSGGFDALTRRGFVQQCTDHDVVSRELNDGKVVFYVGFDPTGRSLHAGHLIPLFALAHLVRAGHTAIALVGGGTARIGDPSGKTEMRRMLTVEDIQANAFSIRGQIDRFLSAAGASAEIVDNADWLADLNYIEFLRDIGRHFSVNRMLSFETYKMRLETGLSFIEFNYQLLQSYDFLELYRRHGCTLQVGGDDQWGNIVAGADLIRRVDAGLAQGLTFPLVTRADGKKMGKTEKGAVFLDPDLCSPYDFFQYWRNVPDQDVGRFLNLYTFLPDDEVARLAELRDREVNVAKESLAYELTRLVHGAEEANAARGAARAAFTGGAATEGTPELILDADEVDDPVAIIELFVRTGLCGSKSEARRLFAQGGAYVDDEALIDPDATVESARLTEGVMLRAGKKRYYRVVRA
ncbi:MAG: tyrosine--tRNA ligase [Spirochaetaceae bacterium]|nr:MAG: tyrosine--tRNA ligase [Spirochaetaceae bacterium]